MKKTTRLFMALALCGAAFVYTSCTDFSEDIKSANTRIDKVETQHSADIKSLQDQATSIQSQVTALQTASAAADKSIATLESQVQALKAFEAESYQEFKKTTTEDIAAIKTQHALDLKNVNAAIEAAQADIKTLTEFKGTAEAQIQALQKGDELLQKAVDGKVDTSAFNAFVKQAYKDFAGIAEFTDLKNDFLSLTAGSTKTVAQIESALSSLSDKLDDTKAELEKLINTNTGNIDANKKAIDALTIDVEANKASIADLNKAVSDAQDDITSINETIKTLATKEEVKTAINSLSSTVNSKIRQDSILLAGKIATAQEDIDDLEAEVKSLNEKKVNLETYNAKMSEIDNSLKALEIKNVEQDGDIADLDAAVDALEKWQATAKEQISALEKDVETLKADVLDLQSRVKTLEENVATLEDKAKSLETQVKELQAASSSAATSIGTLQNQVKALETFRDETFETYKKDVESKFADNKSKVDSLMNQHALDMKGVNDQIADLENEIKALQEFQAAAEKKIEALEGADELLKEAVNGKVDTADFNAFVEKAYEDFAKLSDFTELKDKFDALTAGSTKTIAQIEAALAQASQSLSETENSLKELIGANSEKIETLQTEVNNNKESIENLVKDVQDAKDSITKINKTLETLASIEYVNTSIDLLKTSLSEKIKSDSTVLAGSIKLANDDIKDLKADIARLDTVKVDLKDFEDQMLALEEELLKQINGKADTLTVNNIKAEVAQLQEDVKALQEGVVVDVKELTESFANRIQSLVFVPEYDDLCAQAYDYVVNYSFDDNSSQANANIVDEAYVCSGWQKVKVSKDEPNTWSLGYNVIYGTFQVYPANLAEDIAENANLYMQFVGLEASRTANDFIVSDDLQVLSANNNTGYIEVRARFATSKIKKQLSLLQILQGEDAIVDKPGAVSLLVSDKAIEVEAENAEGEEEVEADLGRYVASHYAPVAYNNVNVANNYRLANVETFTEYPTRRYQSLFHNTGLNTWFAGTDIHNISFFKVYGQDTTQSWDLANSDPKEDYVDFHKGYDVMMVVNNQIQTLDKAAEELFIPVEAITPNFNLAYDYTDYIDLENQDTADSTKSKTMCFDEFAVDTTKAAVEIKDTIPLQKVINWVEDYVTAGSIWTLHGVPVVAAYDKFAIDWRKLELRHSLDTVTTVPWTYGFALKHKAGSENDYTDPYPYTTMGVYNVTATITDPEKEFKAPEFPSETDPFEPDDYEFYITGDKSQTLQWYLQIMNPRVNDEEKSITANLYISNYEFSKEGDKNITCETSYEDKASKSKVVIYYDFMYGQHPTDLSFNFAKDDFYYEPTITYESIDTFGLGNAVEQNPKYKNYFEDDNAQFLASFNNDRSDVSASKAFSGEVSRAVSKWSCVCLDGTYYPAAVSENSAKVYIRLSQADVEAYSDTYKFVNKLTTWYGVNYTLNADIALKAPGFKLAFWSNKVVEEGGTELYPAPYAMLEGVYEYQQSNNYPPYILDGHQGYYIIGNDNLSQYYKLTNADGGAAVVSDKEKQYLTVKYEIITKENESEGFRGVPSLDPTQEEVSVTYQSEYNNFKFGESIISWENYTARKLATKATLLCYGVVVNSDTLNLYINDPITKFDLKKETIYRERTQNYDFDTAYFWNNLIVEGVLNNGSSKGEAVNLINTEATSQAAAYEFGNPYGLTLKFGESDIKIYEYKDYAKDQSSYKDVTDMLGIQVFYNAEDGYIVYNNNSAIRQTDLVVKVNLSLDHKFNYLNNPTYEKHYQGLTYTLVWPKQELEPGNAAE